jgi:hypothetical protein
VEGGRIDANFEGSGFAQQLERVLSSFFGAIVYVRGGGMGLVCFFYCSMLILQKLLRVKTYNDSLLLDAPL